MDIKTNILIFIMCIIKMVLNIGFKSDKSVKRLVTESITETLNSVDQKTVMTVYQNQTISAKGVESDFNLIGGKFKQTASAYSEISQTAINNAEAQAKIQASVINKSKEVIDGLALKAQAGFDSSKFESTIMNLVRSTNSVTQTCTVGLSQQQGIFLEDIGKDVNLKDIEFEQVADATSKCVQNATNESKVVSDVISNISDIEESIMKFDLFSMGFLIIGIVVIVVAPKVLKAMGQQEQQQEKKTSSWTIVYVIIIIIFIAIFIVGLLLLLRHNKKSKEKNAMTLRFFSRGIFNVSCDYATIPFSETQEWSEDYQTYEEASLACSQNKKAIAFDWFGMEVYQDGTYVALPKPKTYFYSFVDPVCIQRVAETNADKDSLNLVSQPELFFKEKDPGPPKESGSDSIKSYFWIHSVEGDYYEWMRPGTLDGSSKRSTGEWVKIGNLFASDETVGAIYFKTDHYGDTPPSDSSNVSGSDDRLLAFAKEGEPYLNVFKVVNGKWKFDRMILSIGYVPRIPKGQGRDIINVSGYKVEKVKSIGFKSHFWIYLITMIISGLGILLVGYLFISSSTKKGTKGVIENKNKKNNKNQNILKMTKNNEKPIDNGKVQRGVDEYKKLHNK